MRKAWVGGLLLLGLAAGGCARPGVIRNLPDPVFGGPRAQAPPTVEEKVPALVPAPEKGLRRIGAVTIIVDPGHGGRDPGSLGLGGVPEETINLNIGRELARLLEERGARVTMTRSGDSFIELDDRAALADRTHADLLVSIHADSSKRPDVSGATVYIARSASEQSRDAARRIAAALERAGIEVRGISNADYRVLAHHSRPAVLVECGFLTNRAEAQRLGTPAYQARVAAAIAEGIADHFSK